MSNYYRNPLVDHDALASYGNVAFLDGYLGHFGVAPQLTAARDQVTATAQANLEALRKKYGIDVSKKRAEDFVKQKAAEILKSSGAAAAEKFLKEQKRALIDTAEQTLGVDAAKSYMKDFAKGLNIPNMPDIPFQLPSKLSVGELEKAAYGTAKKYAEGLIQSKIGVSLELPRKPTLKEISRSLDSLIPDDAREAIDMALTVGSQLASGAAASALTGVLAATAIGSAIPGLGTLVGLGVGLATVALRGVIIKTFTKSACEMDRSRCKCKTPTPAGWSENRPYTFSCPSPGKRSPIEMLPWIAERQAELNKIVLLPAGCDVGEIPECKRYLATLATLVVPYVGTSIPVMGLPVLEKLLPQYEAAAKYARMGEGYTHQGDAGGLIKYGWSAGTNGLGFTTPVVPPPLATMQARIAKLRDLLARANNIGKTGDITALRWELVGEASNAAKQYALTQNADTEKWFVTLGNAVVKLEQAEKLRQQAEAKTRQEEQTRYQSRASSSSGPLWDLYGQLDQAYAACEPGKPCPKAEGIFRQIVELHRKGMKLPPQPKGSGWDVFEQRAEAAAQKAGMTAAPASATKTAPKAAPATATRPAVKTAPPVKRTDQKIDRLRKEIAELKKKAATAHAARTKAEHAIRTKDVHRQRAVAAGLTPRQQEAALQPAQAQTAAAVAQATSAAADAVNQQLKVKQAALAAKVPLTAVQQALKAPQRPALPGLFPSFFQR